MSDSRDHFVYWLYDANGLALYVGVTRRPEARWRQHGYTKPAMVAKVASRRMSGPYTKDVARRLEREQQEDLQPIWDVNQRRMRERAQLLPRAKSRYVWADEVRAGSDLFVVVPDDEDTAA